MRRFILLCAAVVAMFAGLSPAASAATKTWIGPSSGGNWSIGPNWSPSGAPVAGDTVVFNSTVTSNADLGAVAIGAIVFGPTFGGSVINGAVTINGVSASYNIDDQNTTATANTINATITLTGTTAYFRSQSATRTLKISGAIIGNFGVRVYGPGSVDFSGPGDNAYTGATTVMPQGTLLLSGAGFDLVPGDLFIGDGTGVANSAKVRLTSNFSDLIADTTKVTIASDGQLDMGIRSDTIAQLTGTGSVTMSSGNILTVGDTGNFTFGGVISGTGNVNKVGTGSMTYTAVNAYTGTTTVSGGTLVLSAPSRTIFGPLTIGLGVGTTTTATVRLANDFQMDSTFLPITINADGQLDTGAFVEDLGAVTMNGGQIALAGRARIWGDLSMNGGTITGTGGGKLAMRSNVVATSTGPFGAASIDATVELINSPTTFTVNSGSTQPELTINGAVTLSGPSTRNLIKTGAGTLRLAGTAANDYGGSTTIAQGTLELAKPSGITAITGPVGINLVSASAGGVGKINTIGTVDFVSTPTPLQLVAAPGFTAPIGTVFEIVTNDGTDAVTGTFQGLPQGATVSAGSRNVTISYTGGSGNDITLTVAKNTPVMTLSASPNPTLPPAFGGNTTLLLAVGTVGGVEPTGTVAFVINGTPVPNCSARTLFAGVASCFLPSTSLTVGTASVTASYSGDGNYAAGSPTPLSLVVAGNTTPVLLVQLNGASFGVVTSNPTGISCAGHCSEIYPNGTVVTLTATPNAGSVFVSWGGGCIGRISPCTLTLNGPKFVTARFAPISIVGTTINIDIDGDGKYRPETDGLLITRFIQGLTGPALTAGAVALPSKGGTATRVVDADIENYLTNIFPALDVSWDGGMNNTDGVLIMRYLFGFRGAALVAGVTLGGGVTPAMVEANLQALTP